MGSPHFYKYRSLKDYRRFLDIIVYKRLYASKYFELNDPMEGVFCYSQDVPRSYIDSLRSDKRNTLICSLSQNCDNGLMWSFYADEHKGCCIEVEVTSKKWEEITVEYKHNVFSINDSTSNLLTDVLGRKSVQWQHEQEVRYIRTFQSGQRVTPYVSVKVHRILLGVKVENKDVTFLKKLVGLIDPNICVEQIRRDEVNFGYNSNRK